MITELLKTNGSYAPAPDFAAPAPDFAAPAPDFDSLHWESFQITSLKLYVTGLLTGA